MAEDSIVNLFTLSDQYKIPSALYYNTYRDIHF